ncbi:methyltransferase type 11 [Paenibacillus silvae]|uniref:Methyltransferase type 11 n=1 Tax=Paenibacillus silvae TaxID=1325358 RepID=A0ABQ1ZG31_9BACL|nr:class I SAM-dependent methyltransferase [Paenibacillus silvae]GGH60452.1 methyltransferase type 11 [Paenibacillus silvae]
MENKETFNLVVNEYEQYRPVYPSEMFEDIFTYVQINQEDSILEIGCGTGQATGGLVSKGYTNITCIELGSNLAQFTADKFKSYPSIRVINTSFENWDEEGKRYSLIVSGTAFHFIKPEIGYRRAWELLEDQGGIGLFWTIHVPTFDSLHNEIRSHYTALAPHLDDSHYPSPDEVIQERKEITEQSGLFTDIEVKEYNWIQTCSSDEYVALLNTNSKHQQLAEDVRRSLLERIKHSIDGAGGTIDKQHKVALFLGRKNL